MSKRSPKSVEEKLEVVCLLLHQEQSLLQLSKQYQVNHQTIQSWKMNYEKSGIDGLKESRTRKQYSSELKEQAVQDYLAGKGSLRNTCSNYHISDTYVLRSWTKRYNSDNEFTSTGKGHNLMNKGRKTTFEEGLEIITFIIAHEKDYQAAIERFNISYQQVYSWVRKFEKEGAQGLVDRREKGLESKPNLTEAEELQLKIKQLEERNRYLETEVGFLKKLEAIQGQNRR